MWHINSPLRSPIIHHTRGFVYVIRLLHPTPHATSACSKSTVAELDLLFDQCDEDKSGGLSFDEVKNGLLHRFAQGMGTNPTEDDSAGFFKVLDRNRNYSDFKTLTCIQIIFN